MHVVLATGVLQQLLPFCLVNILPQLVMRCQQICGINWPRSSSRQLLLASTPQSGQMRGTQVSPGASHLAGTGAPRRKGAKPRVPVQGRPFPHIPSTDADSLLPGLTLRSEHNGEDLGNVVFGAVNTMVRLSATFWLCAWVSPQHYGHRRNQKSWKQLFKGKHPALHPGSCQRWIVVVTFSPLVKHALLGSDPQIPFPSNNSHTCTLPAQHTPGPAIFRPLGTL